MIQIYDSKEILHESVEWLLDDFDPQKEYLPSSALPRTATGATTSRTQMTRVHSSKKAKRCVVKDVFIFIINVDFIQVIFKHKATVTSFISSRIRRSKWNRPDEKIDAIPLLYVVLCCRAVSRYTKPTINLPWMVIKLQEY